MADFRGKSLQDVRLYVQDRPIFQVKNADGTTRDAYWMNISAANDKFTDEKDFIDRPSLGFARAYQTEDGETQYDRSMTYSKKQLDKIANAMGLPEDYDVQDMRGQTFTGSLLSSKSKKYPGLVVNTAKPLGAAEPLDKEAHDANTARARELRIEREAKEADAPVVEAEAPAVEAEPELPFD